MKEEDVRLTLCESEPLQLGQKGQRCYVQLMKGSQSSAAECIPSTGLVSLLICDVFNYAFVQSRIYD